MEALVKYQKGYGNVALQDVDQPKCSDDQVLLEIDCCGICGTDLHVFHDTFRNYPPVILGHEFSGTVVETGKKVNSVQKGEKFSVLGATAVKCGECSYCQSGEFMFCKNRRGMGHGVNGAFTKYAAVRPDQLFVIPEGVSMKEAAMVEPMAASVHAVCEIASFKLGDTVLVSGPGPIGLLCVKLLSTQGIKTLIAGTSEDGFRLEKAIEYGAARTIVIDKESLSEIIEEETNGVGVDLAIECAGAEGSVKNCLDSLKALGQHVQVGHFGKDLQVPWDHVAFKQLRINGSVGYTRATWDQTIKILGQGKFKVGDVITHQMMLSEWKKGFDLMETKQAVKIILDPN